MDKELLLVLPTELRHKIEKLPPLVLTELEEIRIRENRPLEIIAGLKHFFIGEQGQLQQDPTKAFIPSSELCRRFIERITNYSLYSMEEELKRGYITVSGGHRIGLAGRTILERGEVKGIRDIGGFNIRIAKEMIGASKPIIKKLLHPIHHHLRSALIIAPPQHGKTTLIRDIARSLSYGNYHDERSYTYSTFVAKSYKVAIVDERSEIAACIRGIPSFDVGPRTDVMDACPKAEGMMMLLRSMSPEVIVVDEIGRIEDVIALKEACHAGVKIIATAHGYNLDELYRREEFRQLLDDLAFELVVELRRDERGYMHRVIDVQQWQQKQAYSV